MTTVVTLEGTGYTSVDVSRTPDGMVFVNAYAPCGSFIATRADNDPSLADEVAALTDEPACRSLPDDIGGRLTTPVTATLAGRLVAALGSFDASVTYGPAAAA